MKKQMRQKMLALEKKHLPTLGREIKPREAANIGVVFLALLPFVGCDQNIPTTKNTITDNTGWKWELTNNLPPGRMRYDSFVKYEGEFDMVQSRICDGADTVVVQIQYGDTIETITVIKEITVNSEN